MVDGIFQKIIKGYRNHIQIISTNMIFFISQWHILIVQISSQLYIIRDMLSDNESGSEGQSNLGVTAVFGIYFCNKCKNVLSPMKANGHNLQFNCPICGVKFVDFSRRMNDDCMLYSKELQIGSKKYVPQEAYIFDPTMPKVDIECPECGYEKAVYFLTPDEGETKIVAKMICASATGTTVKCGNMWDLNDKDLLLRTRVLTEEDQYN